MKKLILGLVFVASVNYFSITSLACDDRVHYTVVDDGYKNTLDVELQAYVYEMCEEYEIPGYEKLVMAKMYCESSYRENVKHKNNNGTYDLGISQINSTNFKWLEKELGITDFSDPEQSIRCGVFMISNSLEDNEYDVHKALVAYNAGQGKVNNGVTESKYSRRVVKIMEQMEEF